MVTMLLHPTGHDVTRSVVDGGHGSLNVVLHSIALLGQPNGWRLYTRFVIAGIVANLLAYVLKAAEIGRAHV